MRTAWHPTVNVSPKHAKYATPTGMMGAAARRLSVPCKATSIPVLDAVTMVIVRPQVSVNASRINVKCVIQMGTWVEAPQPFCVDDALGPACAACRDDTDCDVLGIAVRRRGVSEVINDNALRPAEACANGVCEATGMYRRRTESYGNRYRLRRRLLTMSGRTILSTNDDCESSDCNGARCANARFCRTNGLWRSRSMRVIPFKSR